MKSFLILMALSLVTITVSAQEVTEIKSDTSFLEGREYLEKMNAKTQGRVEPQKPTKIENAGTKEFSEYTLRMTMLMKRLNAGQPLPSQEKLDADLADSRPRIWDRNFLKNGRIEMRLMNERTNPNTPSGKPSGLGNKSPFGAR